MSSISTHASAPIHAPEPSLPPDQHQMTVDYVRATIANPRQNLSTADSRAAFVTAVLGSPSLAPVAENDAPLLAQLDARAVIILHQIELVLSDADAFATDALVSIFALLASKWQILIDTLEREGAVSLVLRAINRYNLRTTVVARCLTALRSFAITDSMRKRLMFDGAIDLTLHLMQLHAASRRVQDRALAVIANVAFGCPHRKRRITRQGAIKSILRAMKTFPNDQSIQLRSALTIRNLTHQTQVNQYIAGNEGAVEAVASTILRFRGASVNPELRYQCIMALESLCRQDEPNRQRLIEVDTAQCSFPNALSCTSAAVSKQSDDDFDEFVNEDGDVVVEEEQILSSDATPHFQHGAALCPGKSITEIMATTSVSSSACSDRAPTTLVSVQDASGERDDQRDKLSTSKTSIIRAILHAMRREPNDPLLLQTALSVLTLIALHNANTQLRIGHFGGIQVSIATIKRHPKNPDVVTKASALIRCVCIQEANRRLVTSGLHILVSTLSQHHANSNVVCEIAAALSNSVFENEKNRAWVVNKGGIEAIVSAMDEGNHKDVMVLDAGICAMRNFVDSSYNGAMTAISEGAIKAATKALDRTKEAATKGECIVQEQAVLFLVDVASVAPQSKKHMCEIDACDWIENALAKLPDTVYPDLHSVADQLITELTDTATSKFSGKKSAVGSQRLNLKGSSNSPRGIFGGLFFPRRSATMIPAKKRSVGRITPQGNLRSEPSRKPRRFSSKINSNPVS